MKYRIYEQPRQGSGHDCGIFTLDELPERLAAAVAADPDAGHWRLPALSGGDTGVELDDLDVIVTRV